MSSRTFSFRIFRVALLFICQGTSKADSCVKVISESLLSGNCFHAGRHLRQHSVSSFAANWLCNKLSLSHVCFASSAINGDHQRRRRDLNPRAAINDLLPFQGSPFSLLGTSPQKLTYDSIYKVRGEGISSGEGGIRTHAPLRTNGFQDRLVMTTSIPLHVVCTDSL